MPQNQVFGSFHSVITPNCAVIDSAPRTRGANLISRSRGAPGAAPPGAAPPGAAPPGAAMEYDCASSDDDLDYDDSDDGLESLNCTDSFRGQSQSMHEESLVVRSYKKSVTGSG